MSLEHFILPYFNPLTQDVSNKIYSQSLQLQSYFWINKNKNQQIYVIQTQNYIILADKNNLGLAYRYYLKFDYQVKYQVLFQGSATATSDQNSIYKKSIGFKLIKSKTAPLQFQLVSSQIISFWLKNLSKNLNQLGFHQFYRPTRKLGKGGFATVYQVQRNTDKKRFAVKAFSKQNTINSQKPQNRQNLLNQIKLMRMFNSPHIIKIQGVFQSQNSLYVILQLLNAGQLHTRINKRYGKFNLSQIKNFLYGLCKGLKDLHEHRIMHRDLKPENIMLRSQDTLDPVIVDFGLAANVDSDDYIFYRCGTPGYVAPQITRLVKGQKIEPLCDIFSAGAIFHILLTGRPLFQGKTFEQAYENNRLMKFDLNSQAYSQYDPTAMNLLKQMLQINAKDRITASKILEHAFFEDIMLFQINNKFSYDTKQVLGSSKKAFDQI